MASYFKVDFSANPVLPSSEMVRVANQKLLDCLASADFGEKAAEIGEKMWSGNLEGSFNENEIAAALEEGNQLRRRKRHYLGAMFYFDGEWYWGLDRLHLLEERLCSLGFGQGVDTDLCVPQPEVDSVSGLNANSVTLEYFPSLRSPYTAVGHGRVMDLVDRSGVQLRIRPVMPMMMRGVSAPIDKQLYIISDSKREAAANNVRFGNFVDPFGEPVKRAFSLYPWVESQGRGGAFITAYLEAAWADGLDIGSDAGLRQIIESIELDWKEALSQFDNDQWERLLDDNVQEMLAEGLWGVPSFRITGGNRDDGFSCWGQDRIWRVEAEISRRVN